MSVPIPTAADAISNAVFEELMWAMSRPGLTRSLPAAGLAPLGQSLIDRECSFHVIDSQPLAEAIASTGARAMAIDEADYVFAASLSSQQQVSDLKGLRIGTLAYPDKAATLFASAQIGHGQALRLSGPGIKAPVVLELGGVDPLFWSIREKALRYPLGWDVYFVDVSSLVCIPRSTKVEVL